MAGMPVHRQGDLDTGHGCWPPRPTSSWASRTYVNNLLVHRDGDAYEVHCCPGSDCHAGTGAGGSATVFVENKALRRVGDAVSCGGTAAEGSPNVFCG